MRKTDWVRALGATLGMVAERATTEVKFQLNVKW